MSYDPNQPPSGTWPAGGVDYQPPEGTHPGTFPPPPPGGGWSGAPPPPPYYGGYPAYPGPMAPSTSPWAIASLVCSIANWLGLVGIGAILAIIFGHIALHEIKVSEGRVEGRGMALAGLIIGYATLALGLCVLAGLIAAFALKAPTSQP